MNARSRSDRTPHLPAPAPGSVAGPGDVASRRPGRRRRRGLLVALVLVALVGGVAWWVVSGWRDTGTTELMLDFDGPAGTPVDSSIWTLQTGGGGWGNDELQDYTEGAVALDGEGSLAITATVPRDGSTPTSGRITSQGKWSFTHGTLSARIKLPEGMGLLPAFWLMGDSLPMVGWPAAGEIDVIETPSTTVRSTHHVHGPRAVHGKFSLGGSATFSTPLSADFHTYTVERTPGRIVMLIDDVVVFEADEDDVPAGGTWVFDERFHVLFSLAVGGDWPGAPDVSTPETSTMLIDWIHFVPLAPEE